MKINLMKIQKFLDKFGLVLICEFLDESKDGFPANFPSKIWITRKDWYKIKTERKVNE